jgi:hypothetical protein
LNFGVLDDDTDGTLAGDLFISAGVITIANALFSCLVLCSHPAFRGDTQAAEKPEELSEQQVQLYLAQHPELMHSAVQGMTTEQAPQGGQQKSDFGAGASAAAPPAVYTPPAVPIRSSTPAKDDNPFGGQGSSDLRDQITNKPAQAPPAPARTAVPAPTPVPAPAPAAASSAKESKPESNPFDADDNPFA